MAAGEVLTGDIQPRGRLPVKLTKNESETHAIIILFTLTAVLAVRKYAYEPMYIASERWPPRCTWASASSWMLIFKSVRPCRVKS